MLKRFVLALSLLTGLISPALAAGTITMSLTQRFDNSTHSPLSGGKIYFIQAGTTSTPQNAYQDSALTLPYANPLTLDSGGNVPQLFFADGVIKVRITNSLGVQQLVQDNIQVTGASSGGGGGGTVDPTTIIATGDLKARYGTGVLTGFVRANGRTIGSATSGATERANSDTQSLFEYLWSTDANLAVSGGRGASANADYIANKTIALPDWRGRALAFLDDMGNSAAGRITATGFGTATTVLGAASTFLETRTIINSWLPPYTPSGTVSVTSTRGDIVVGPSTTDNYASIAGVCCYIGQTKAAITSTGSLTGTAQGGTSTPFSAIPPTMLATIYVKL